MQDEILSPILSSRFVNDFEISFIENVNSSYEFSELIKSVSLDARGLPGNVF